MDNLDASPDQVYQLQKVFVLVTAIPYFVLIWDWLTNLSKEYSFIRRRNGSSTSNGGGVGALFSIRNTFIASRYITLIWCTFVIVVLGNIGRHPSLCSWSKYFPYGYSTTMLFAHFVMVLRMYSIYERSTKILIFLLSLTTIDYILQMSANHAATSIYLSSNQIANLSICFIVPTNLLYSMVFISPTIFHHIILIMTLYKSILHIKATKAGGIKSIMNIVQRDQILFVLAICLINFSNLVLVLQGSSWPYRLINQLPAAVFTQIFLSKIIFNMKHVQKKLASASVSPVITTLALSPSSRRGEFNFGESSYYNDDLELGADFKLSSINSPSLSKNNHQSEDTRMNNATKKFSEGVTVNSRKGDKTFTLKFDPISRNNRKQSQQQNPPTSTTTTTTFSPDIPSTIIKNKDAFKIEQDQMDSHDLSSYRLPSPRKLDSNEIESPYAVPYSNLERHPSPTSPAIDEIPYSSHTPMQHHQSNTGSGSKKMDLSSYFGMALTGNEGMETPMPQFESSTTKSVPSQETNATQEGHSKPSLHVDTTEERDQTAESIGRPSIDSINRRASTIDDQQKQMDWEPPTAWGTTQSRGASPIPFSERRLSNSVARNSLSLQRSRHASLASRNGGGGSAAIGTGTGRPSFDGSPSSILHHQLRSNNNEATSTTSSNSPSSGGSNNTSALPMLLRANFQQQQQHRGSACYASVFSFENDDRHDEGDEEN